MTEIERELERLEIENRYRTLVWQRHLMMYDEKRKLHNDKFFEIMSLGALAWAFALLICITVMMFAPLFK